jgi:uncharacterized phage-like protein YoqJ
MEIISGITGHRPQGLGCGWEIPNPTYNKICKVLEDKFKELNTNKIISGMALGVDQYAIDVAIKLNIPFIAAVPCDNQDLLWTDVDKLRYHSYLKLASEVVIVSPGPYAPDKMYIRDKWIVNKSTNLIAVWNGIKKGGTFSTLRYAQKQQVIRKDYIINIINPTSL